MKQTKNDLYSEYQIQKNGSYCAAYCLYILILTHLIGFENAVLNLYYQVFMNIKRRKSIIIQLNLKVSNEKKANEYQ